MTVGIPASDAIRAARTLLRMPPRPSWDASPSASAPTAEPSATSSASGGSRRPRVHALDLGQEHEQASADEDRDLGGERVVVAERDLVRRGRVVLVHDRHRPEREERRAAHCAR